MPANNGHGCGAAAVMLANAAGTRQYRSVVFAGTHPGAGVTTNAVAVTQSLAREFSLRPLLVEIPAGRPVCTERYNLDPGRTVEACAGGKPVKECAQSAAGIWFLPAAGTPGDAEGALTAAPAFRRILEEAEREFDFVVVDAPPPLQSPATLAALGSAPRLIVVAEAGRTRRATLARIRREMITHKVAIVGAILNKHRQYVPGWIRQWLTE